MWTQRKGIMLAYPLEEKRLVSYPTPWIVQPKLDGERCRAVISNDGSVTLLSSEENVITSVPHINSALMQMDLAGVELDGELYRHDTSFEEIHSIVSRKANIHTDFESIGLFIFDIISEDAQLVRLARLRTLLDECKHPLYCVRSTMLKDLMSIGTELLRSEDEGFEGIIIRHPYMPYVRKRSVGMMKFKPKKSDLYLIIDTVEEVDQYGTKKGALGALVCMSDKEHFQVGSGPVLTREGRERLWRERETLKNKYALVQYQHLTSGRGVPRFPVLVEIVDNFGIYFAKGEYDEG